MQQLKILLRFIKFYWQSTTLYRVHSPFVYDFTENILDDERNYYAFQPIEILRKKMLKDYSNIQVTDYGAGSKIDGKKTRTIKSITKYSATWPFFCQVLFKVINHYKPQTALELGTSLGVSSLYQAAAMPKKGTFMTLEGCPNISKFATTNFQRLEVKNINLLTGRFEKTLPTALKQLKRLDYVFIDGNHKKEPTLAYFNQCLEYAHEDSIFVMDDIYWSAEMIEAWEAIKQHPKVKITIDLFFCGVVFFRKEQKIKEHFKLVPATWKPWVMGFFS